MPAGERADFDRSVPFVAVPLSGTKLGPLLLPARGNFGLR